MAEVRGASKLGIKVDGLDELQAQFDRIGKIPKKYLTKAAREAIDKPLKDAKKAAPFKTGALRKSITKLQETPNKRNKGVYRLRYHPKFTDVFRKPTTGAFGGETPYAYYPNSIEYGFKTAKGRVEGQYNMRDAVRDNTTDSLQKLIKSLGESVDTLLKSR